ncbi:MAG: ABC transporter permease [Acidithiobacillales bacterium]
MRFLPLVLKNLLRKKTRTLLTVASILFPLLVVAFLGTFLTALHFADPARKGFFRVVTRHKVGLATPIPVAWARRIERLPGVVAVTVLSPFRGIYRDESAGNVFPRFAADAATFLSVFDDAVIVGGSAKGWQSDRSSALVGERLMEKYGWTVGDRVVIRGTLYPVNLDLVIAAVYRLPYETSGSIFFHREVLEEAWPPFRGQATTIWARVKDNATAARLPGEIDPLFENSPFPTKSDTESAFLTGFVQLLGNVQLLLTSLTVILVLVIVLVAANTMAMATRERVVEIAVMRALGYSRARVVALILAESLFMALAGAVLGLGLFVAAFPSLQQRLLDTRLSQFAAEMRIFPGVLALAVGTALLIGLLAALVPALRAAGRRIVDGLRFTG